MMARGEQKPLEGRSSRGRVRECDGPLPPGADAPPREKPPRAAAVPIVAIRGSSSHRIAIGFLLLLATLLGMAAGNASFESANQLYFESKFAEAASTYEELLESGQASAAVYFNLGNARFKAGQKGRAIAAYRRALLLTPRDPAVRFNLKFVREQVSGSDAPGGSAWKRMLARLTLNEWVLFTAGGFWLSCALAAVREWRSGLRRPLRPHLALAGAFTVLMAFLTAFAWRSAGVTGAVVIVPEAVVRLGPLERASVAFQLRDGSELTVLDRQEIADGDRKQTWVQVQDAGQRSGWVKQEQVAVLRGR